MEDISTDEDEYHEYEESIDSVVKVPNNQNNYFYSFEEFTNLSSHKNFSLNKKIENYIQYLDESAIFLQEKSMRTEDDEGKIMDIDFKRIEFDNMLNNQKEYPNKLKIFNEYGMSELIFYDNTKRNELYCSNIHIYVDVPEYLINIRNFLILKNSESYKSAIVIKYLSFCQEEIIKQNSKLVYLIYPERRIPKIIKNENLGCVIDYIIESFNNNGSKISIEVKRNLDKKSIRIGELQLNIAMNYLGEGSFGILTDGNIWKFYYYNILFKSTTNNEIIINIILNILLNMNFKPDINSSD